MLSSNVTSTTTSAPASSTSNTASNNMNNLGQKDIFLKLLVAQMQFQNPMKPQDPTAMSQQLAQFNMVEQQTNTNKLLQQLVDNGGVGGTSSSGGAKLGDASYLGHTVMVNQSTINFDGTNPQSFNLKMDAATTDTVVVISDTAGNPVFTSQLGALQAGDNGITWNGTTDTGGTAPAGNYTINFSALDLGGNDVTGTVQRSGTVDAVRYGSNGTELVVGGIPASLADITEIRL